MRGDARDNRSTREDEQLGGLFDASLDRAGWESKIGHKYLLTRNGKYPWRFAGQLHALRVCGIIIFYDRYKLRAKYHVRNELN